MRNPVGWPNVGPVSSPSASVRFRGADRPVESVSITRSIPQLLDQRVVGAGGINAASATVDWAPEESVGTKPLTPWTGSPAQAGESIWIDAGLGDRQVRSFTGLVDSSSGSFGEAGYSSDLIDAIDRLNRTVRFDALHTTMPPRVDGVFRWRQIGLCSTYFTDRTLRACGYYATAPMETGCVFSAPLMGSTWPEKGTLESSQKANGTWHLGPNFGGMPTGVGLWDVRATWSPADYEKSLRWDTFQITFNVGRLSSQFWTKAGIQWADGGQVMLQVTPARDVLVSTYAGSTMTTHRYVGSQNDIWTSVSLRLNPVDGSFRVRFDNGKVVSGTIGGPAPDTWAAKNWVAFMDSPSWYVNGFQVSFPGAEEFKAVQHKPTAVLTPPTSAAGPEIPELGASPAIPPTPAIDLLKEQAEAELAAMWIDEDGVFRWSNREGLRDQPVRAEYTSEDSLLDVSWSVDSQATRRKVSVKYRQTATKRSFRHSILAWQGNSQELEAGDVHEEFIESGEDIDWIDVDTDLKMFGAGRHAEFNRGRGSWQGYQNLDKDGKWANIQGTDSPWSFTQVTPGTWKYRITITSVPTGVDRVKMSTREEDGLLAPTYRGEHLPMLRCRALVQWTNANVDASVSGPSWAQGLEHDSSWWVQSPAEAQALANEIGKALAAPTPVIDSVKLLGDARLQLGDKIRVKDPALTGVCIVGIVADLKHSISAGDHTMDVKLIPTTIMTPKTLGDLDAQWAGKSLAQLDAYWEGKNLGNFDSNYRGECDAPINPGPLTPSNPPTLGDLDTKWAGKTLTNFDTSNASITLGTFDSDPLK